MDLKEYLTENNVSESVINEVLSITDNWYVVRVDDIYQDILSKKDTQALLLSGLNPELMNSFSTQQVAETYRPIIELLTIDPKNEISQAIATIYNEYPKLKKL